MSEIRLLARLNKNRYRVVCGAIDCGTVFAEIDSLLAQLRPDLARREGIPPDVEVAPILRVPPGWDRHSRDGVWRMSRRAWQRLSEGRTYGWPARRAPRPELRGRPYYWPGSPSNGSMIYVKAGLSELFECPACRRTQLVDGDVLGINELVLERHRALHGEWVGE